HGILSFVVVPLSMIVVVCWSLLAIVIFNKHYNSEQGCYFDGLYEGCTWLWYCSRSMDAALVKLLFDGTVSRENKGCYWEGLAPAPTLLTSLVIRPDDACCA